MKWNPRMRTCPCLLFMLAWLISSSFHGATRGINLVTHSNIRCIGKEREALLQFNSGGVQENDQLDCCRWQGIRCDNRTGHVIKVDLRGMVDVGPAGKISPSLLELKHLKYLDLSGNDFQGQPIPSFIGSLHSLRHLNLSQAGFQGEIPHQLANLSNLISLDLSYNPFISSKSLGWLSYLTYLRDISLSDIDLSQAIDWLQVVNGLPFLRRLSLDQCFLSATNFSLLNYKNSSTTLRALTLSYNYLNDSSILQWVSNLTGISTSINHLDLSYNRIPGPIPSGFGNMHSLSYLDLSGNAIQGSILNALGNMHSLSYLDLSHNQLEGQIPGSIFELKCLEYLSLRSNNFQVIQFSNSSGNLCSLRTLDFSANNITNDFSSILQLFSGCENKLLLSLDVSYNRFWGSIPNMISTFSSMEKLSLHSNQLNGTLNPGLGQLSRLEWLDLSSNSLRGTLSDQHLSNLSRLSLLDLSDNLEVGVSISSNWVPPFQLDYISLRSCKVGPYFPKWLLNQTNFSTFDISNSGIRDKFPSSFWKSLPPNLEYLNLSHNEIYGVFPNLSKSIAPGSINIDLSSNHIEGAIPSFIGTVNSLFLNDNLLSGSIAPLCPKTKDLSALDLSNNLLSGELPDCWENFKQLQVLRLDNNYFTGELPSSIGALNELEWLSLRSNSLHGKLQMLFENCTSLVILDVSYNSFTGYIPPGIGSTLKSIQILDLRRKKLLGGLPLSLCQLTSLQILDLSFNRISGTIPECICNLQAMANSTDNKIDFLLSQTYYLNYASTETIMWKRKEQNFSSNLGLVRYIAISDNELVGHIPRGISCLRGLVSLDFARNNLTGSIPPRIGELTSLDFLDLSSNHLSGQIPSSLANLHFRAH